MRSILLAFGFCAAATAASAGTTTADFEGLTTGTLVANSVTSGGYAFTASNGTNLGVIINGNQCSPVCADDGTATLVFGTPGINPPTVAPLVITGPTDFSLQSLDYAEISPSPGFNAVTLRIVGVLADGSGVLQDVLDVPVADGPGGAPDFAHADFS